MNPLPSQYEVTIVSDTPTDALTPVSSQGFSFNGAEIEPPKRAASPVISLNVHIQDIDLNVDMDV